MALSELTAAKGVENIVAIKEHVKERLEDKELFGDVSDCSFERKELVRVFAVGLTFKGISFKQAQLSACYFRKCTFIECDFTGAQIRDSNLKGSTFSSCKFQYSTWEKTLLDDQFLGACLPSEGNLARDLVRSLRVNFSQVGNYEAVNRAAALEVKLTGQHLYNAAYSSQSYYRHKYKGVARLSHAFQHAWWKALDLLWGNGESLIRVVVTGIIVVLLAAGYTLPQQPKSSFADTVRESFFAFWGVALSAVPNEVGVGLSVAKYVVLGLLMAILVKKLSRR